MANAPGGPVHVLLTDTLAEHIPGCNMSFRKSALETVGGFDPRYRAAGDDVDLCWRIQEQVGRIGFHAAAMDWHHRRNSLRMYWKQQQGYGKAEALLEEKWPEKYNALGHISWGGHLYGKGLTLDLGCMRGRIYQGVWGSAPFLSLYQPAPGTLLSLPLMPEWYLLIGLLAVLSLLGFNWTPLAAATPLLLFAIVLPVSQALLSASRARFTSSTVSPLLCGKLILTTAFLHIQQPLARLIGRLKHGLTPWRRRGMTHWKVPLPTGLSLWHEQWEPPTDTLNKLRVKLSAGGAVVESGDDFDAWDLEVRGGLFGRVRLLLATEEHGAGRQMLRYRLRPRWNKTAVLFIMLFAVISTGAALDGAWFTSTISALFAILSFATAIADSGFATGTVSAALRESG